MKQNIQKLSFIEQNLSILSPKNQTAFWSALYKKLNNQIAGFFDHQCFRRMKYLLKCSLTKHTCSWRDKRILWTLNRQLKVFLPYKKWKLMFLTEYCEACSNIFKTAKECFKLSDERKAKIKKKKNYWNLPFITLQVSWTRN